MKNIYKHPKTKEIVETDHNTEPGIIQTLHKNGFELVNQIPETQYEESMLNEDTYPVHEPWVN